MPHITYTYDGSFDGFMSVVFEIFQRRQWPLQIVPHNCPLQLPIFEERLEVVTDQHLAGRVKRSIQKKSNSKNLRLLHVSFLSGEQEAHGLLWRYIYKLLNDKSGTFFRNMLDRDVYDVVQTARRVKREVHRFHGFLRFQKTPDGMYVAAIDPDHQILGLLVPHFQSRFPDVNWLIYDMKRKIGVFYDQQTVKEVTFEGEAFNPLNGQISKKAREMAEDHYRVLWQHYYDAISIRERRNLRQMKACMPVRYWKYLPEKDGSVKH